MKNSLSGKKATFRFVKKGTVTPGKVLGKATVTFKKIPTQKVNRRRMA